MICARYCTPGTGHMVAPGPAVVRFAKRAQRPSRKQAKGLQSTEPKSKGVGLWYLYPTYRAQAAGRPATASRARRKGGMETITVEARAFDTIAIAAKGKAAGSTAVAAVPMPCPAAPIASPRATGDLTPVASSRARPKLATSRPVSTTTVHAMPGSAPTRPEMAMARGAVTCRGRQARVSASLSPNARAAMAEPKSPPNEAAVTAPPTAGSDDMSSLRFSYMLNPNDSVAGPSMARSTFPGADSGAPPGTRYPRTTAW
eukprot:scaffold19031_cov110-Isochrysis_galbana.AAC.2